MSTKIPNPQVPLIDPKTGIVNPIWWRFLRDPAFNTVSAPGLFESGTVMVFFQAAAPTGWTQLTSHNDKALRVVSAAGGGSGGVHGLSSPPSTVHAHTAPSHTHAGADHYHGYNSVISHQHTFTSSTDPGHTHAMLAGQVNIAYMNNNTPVMGATNATGSNTTGQVISGGAHNHTGTTDATGVGAANTYYASGSGSGVGTTGAGGGAATTSDGPTAFQPKYIDVIVCQMN